MNRPAARRVVGFALLTVVLGVLAGAAWVAVAPRPAFLRGTNGLYFKSSLPGEFVAMDGWFAVFTALAGVVLAVVVLRRTEPGVLVVVLAAVAGVLGSLVAWGTGHLLEPDKARFAPVGVIGAVQYGPMSITAKGVLVAWPVVTLAVLVFALAWQAPKPVPEPALEPEPASVGGDGQMGELGTGE